MFAPRYSKKRKALLGPDGQPLNLLRVNDGPSFHTFHQEAVEAKTASIEESMVVGDKQDNQIELAGAASGTAPRIVVSGIDANIGLNIETKGSGYIRAEAPITVGEGDENSVTIVPAVAGNIPYIGTTGDDVTIGLDIRSKGRAAVRFTGEGSASTNCISINPTATGTHPSISALGVDTNIDLQLRGKGSGVIVANNAVRAATLDAENNIIEMRAADGNYCEISTTASATDAQVAIHLTTKGGGAVRASNRVVSFYGSSTSSELSVDSGIPALVSSGAATDIDLKLMPKGMGVTRTGWGYYEGQGTSTQALTAVGGMEKLAVSTTAVINSFPTGAFGIEGTGTRFRNTSGRTAQYIVSYTIGTPNAFTNVLDVHIRKYTSADVFSARYAQNRLTGVGSDGPVACGQASIRLDNNEYFEIVGDTTADTTVGNNAADSHSRYRVTVQQIS